MGIFLFHISQHIFCLVGGSVVDDNDFKLRVILFQDSRKEFAQVISFVARTDDDGKWRQFPCEVNFLFAHCSVTYVYPVVQTEIVNKLNDKEYLPPIKESARQY